MKVRELLDSPEKWTKNVLCRDAAGMESDLKCYGKVVSYCLMGAVYRCYLSDKKRMEITELIERAIFERCGERISDVIWNDARERTFEQVKQLVDELDI